ncbi:BTAD domain-containing putative transcriptional regulator [Streptomyces rimosus]|uniref:AfsR/SARP family transcriptional regulator n=1 Tax=Streptomyces rimosus TaxID=1927 RepID=UPI0004CAA1A8|nr:BTAD domain-containing putative transcriptional regulator [Streptomyces rimosus]
MHVDIRVLGPVDIRLNGRPDPLGSLKERALLAALAVDAGRPVPLDTLIARLWDDHPPAKARAGLHSYAARLRRRLRAGDGSAALTQQAHAYTLDVPPGRVDCHRFRDLAARARALADAGDDSGALAVFEEAEALWRGEPLCGLYGLWAEGVRARLAEHRLAATLRRVAIGLRRGRFAELTGELAALWEQHPTDEDLVAQLMIANYGCGRQADALRAYETTRRRLATELGTAPGEALARIHRHILDGAPVDRLLPRGTPPPAAAAPPAVAAPGPGAPPVPDNLPSHGELVGREDELRVLTGPVRDGAVIALQAISGMAGVGKSLLAVHLAHRLARRYPDGRIYLDLCAHAPGRPPLTPQAALAALLRVLGVPADGIPRDPDALTSLWRALLSTRRAVVVLDDAAGPDQVRPLLPVGSRSLTIITSRRRMAGVPGIRPVFLDVLPPQDAATLFVRLVGDDRAGDPAEVAAVVRLCGRLPLAVELAAGRLVSRPSWTTAHLVQRLSREPGRLGEIRDPYRDIARVFEMSYYTLDDEQRTVFRLLALHPGPQFGPHAAAALTGLPLAAAERTVEALLDAHLVQEPEADRYQYHDLIAEYALTLAAKDPPEVREAALHRLSAFYLCAADRADRLVNPRRSRLDVPYTPDPELLPRWNGAQEAKEWLAAEHQALFAAEQHARTHGAPDRAAWFGHVLAAFLDTEGHWAEAERIHRHAALYWQQCRDRRAEARAQTDLSTTHAHAGRYPQAEAAGRRALELARAVGDTEAEAEALQKLGVLHWHRGEYRSMLAVQSAAVELRMRSGDRWNQARSTNNLGIAHLHLGDPAAAMLHFRRALSMFREIGDKRGETQSLNNLADAQLHTGEQEAARTSFAQALAIAAESGSRSEQAMARINLASTFRMPQELGAALGLYAEALRSFQQLGDRRNETITLVNTGNALRDSGEFAASGRHYEKALELARAIGAGLEEAQALRGLGVTGHRLGLLEVSAGHLELALSVARRIGSPEEEARSCDALAELHLASGDRGKAGALWRIALELFERLDAFEFRRVEGRAMEVGCIDLRE